MKILVVHNSYQQPGGEDVVFEAEKRLLTGAGHRVSTYARSNHEIDTYNWLQKASLAPRTIWAWDSFKQMRSQIARERPDIVHFHNTFPLVSPSAYLACRETGVPLVQTLHNSRLMCPAATLYRNGSVCEECSVRTVPWPAVLHGCYRDSRLQSAVVATMLAIHRQLRTWQKLVDHYIASTEFFARKFIAAGLPADRISVKPHFVSRNHREVDRTRDYALFVGRLAPEKGVSILLDAWKFTSGIRLKIRGEGALLPRVSERANDPASRVEWVPRPTNDDLIDLFQHARFLVWPSQGHYESFGLVAIEAFACGIPVIASRSGVMAEIVRDGVTGLHFTSGSPNDLAAKIEWAWNHPSEVDRMGQAARVEYEAKYTPERNYEMLMDIYRSAIESRGHAAAAPDVDAVEAAVTGKRCKGALANDAGTFDTTRNPSEV